MTENFALKVENLSKYYRLGAKESERDSIFASMVEMLKSPLKPTA